MPITALQNVDLPDRNDPSTFNARMAAFLTALYPFADQANSLETSLTASVHFGTSTTSVAIGTGSKTLTTQTGKAWVTGTWLSLVALADVTRYLYGQVTSYNSGTGALTVNVTEAAGSGTYASWGIALQTVGGTTPGAMRNLLTNGDMRIDQRNSGAAQTITAGAAQAYTVDRWYAYCTGASVTGQRVAGSGEPYVYRFTGAAGCTGVGFGQRIEADDCKHLAGTTAVLSVSFANSLLTTVTWTAYYATTADVFGTLAAPTRTQIATGSFTVNGTLSRYQVPISIPAGATTGIEIVFSVGAQTSGTWQIGAAQLEAGGVATVFERRPVAQELARCQRCYIASTGAITAAGYAAGAGADAFQSVGYPVQMRGIPTLTPTYGAAAGATAVVTNGSVTGFQVKATSTGAGQFAAILSGYTANAEL